METSTAILKSLALIERAPIAMVGSVNTEGFPNIKAMLNLEHTGLGIHFFSTNTSSRRVGQFLNNAKACVYFVDEKAFEGLMLVGQIQVLTDPDARRRLWREGFERYYPQGVDDPDYCVLQFCASRGNYYHGLANVDFDIPQESSNA
jgi:general stress protein 26